MMIFWWGGKSKSVLGRDPQQFQGLSPPPEGHLAEKVSRSFLTTQFPAHVAVMNATNKTGCVQIHNTYTIIFLYQCVQMLSLTTQFPALVEIIYLGFILHDVCIYTTHAQSFSYIVYRIQEMCTDTL